MSSKLQFMIGASSWYLDRHISGLRGFWLIHQKKLGKLISWILIAGFVLGLFAGAYRLLYLWQHDIDLDKFLFTRSVAAKEFWLGVVALMTAIYISTIQQLSEKLKIDTQKPTHKASNALRLFGKDLRKAILTAQYRGYTRWDQLLVIFSNSRTGQQIFRKAGIEKKHFDQALTKIKPENDLFGLLQATAIKHQPAQWKDFFQILSENAPSFDSLLRECHLDRKELLDNLQLLAWEGEWWQSYRQLLRESTLKPSSKVNRAMTSKPVGTLSDLSRDITDLARLQKLSPHTDRQRETQSLIRTLKKQSGSALIIGESGVGKTALVEHLGQLMAAEKVPSALADKRLLSINVGALATSAKSNQISIIKILEEAAASKNIILLIEDFANIVGLESEGGSLDALSMVGNYAASGDIQIIGTITPADFSKHLQNHTTTLRHFEQIKLEEFGIEDTLRTVLVHSRRLESKLQLLIPIPVCKKIISYASRFFPEKFQPGKSLSLLEEVALLAREKNQHTVSLDDLSTIITEKTNIDTSEVNQDEGQKLAQLEQKIHERMIGQDEAVGMVSAAIRRSRLNLRDEKKTIANFLFLGPTGVGKTELAKTLAEVYFRSESNLLRLDMSEYQEVSTIKNLIGTPESSGSLTEAVRRKPFTILLLDELEKAHPDVLNIFLQIMDDGRLTDGAGRLVDFSNVILIATSNVGAHEIKDAVIAQTDWTEFKKNFFEKTLYQSFRPEFLNRFDGVSLFTPLRHSELEAISTLFLKNLKSKLEEKGIVLEWSNDFLKTFVEKNYNFSMGARPLRRAVQEQVSDPIAEKMLLGELSRNQKVSFSSEGIQISNL